MVVEISSGVAFTALVLLITLYTSMMLRSWRQEVAVQEASLARKHQILSLLRTQQRASHPLRSR